MSSTGKASIGALASEHDISRQHLNRLFIDAVGLSAKATARLIRFEAAVAAMQQGLPLAEVAAPGRLLRPTALQSRLPRIRRREPEGVAPPHSP